MWGLKIFSIILISSLKIDAVIFNCEFSTNSCTITNGTISSKSDATVTSITGTYPSGTTSNSITVIDGRGVEIRYFPLGLTKFFPNIDVIFFEGGLREIHKEDLQQFGSKLKRVYMSYNSIEMLEKNLFVYNPNIEYIYLDDNNIKYVDPDVLDSLNRLTNLGFSINYCYSGKVEYNRNGVLDLIDKLRYLCSTTDDENIRKIIGLQSNIENLNKQNSNLAKNCSAVNTVEFQCDYSDSNTCKVINGSIATLDDALLFSIFGTHVYGEDVTSITTFDARGQLIRFFPRLIDLVFPNLENIYIEGGMYELHREDIEFLPKLKGLYLSYNNIEYLEPNLFLYNPKLETIILEANNLKFIDLRIISNLPKLTTLDLTKNNCFSGVAKNSRLSSLSLFYSATSACSLNFNLKLTTILNLKNELQRLVLVNGNLTAKCAKNEFVPNNSTFIKLF
ncbi:hypothetical protein PVAND_000461 [Polypedilum vanderplanki]|uniref:Uncharacterized protein n=1 Tax=Polypedilum vanderplanki TaxID=319348 RepID=A0A9J6BK62_POLVA|nr:hypothetical protein PVAND_000461 [Polypedilum vanderplanki]